MSENLSRQDSEISDLSRSKDVAVDSGALLRFTIPYFIPTLASLGLVIYASWKFSLLTGELNPGDEQTLRLIARTSTEIMRPLAWGIFLTTVASYGFWILFHQRIFKPMLPIQKHLQNLSRGDYTSRVLLGKNDEFKDVANEANALAERLENRNSQMRSGDTAAT